LKRGEIEEVVTENGRNQKESLHRRRLSERE